MNQHAVIIREHIIKRNSTIRMQMALVEPEALKASLQRLCDKNHEDRAVIDKISKKSLIVVSEYDYKVDVFDKDTYKHKSISNMELYFEIVNLMAAGSVNTITDNSENDISLKYKKEKMNKNKDIVVMNGNERVDIERQGLKARFEQAKKGINILVMYKHIDSIEKIVIDNEKSAMIVCLQKGISYRLKLTQQAFDMKKGLILGQ